MKRMIAGLLFAFFVFAITGVEAFDQDDPYDPYASERKAFIRRLEGHPSIPMMGMLDFVEPLVDVYESNDTMFQAKPIAFGDTVSALIDPRGDYDYFWFEVATGDTVHFDVDAWVLGSELDAYITIYGPEGYSIMSSHDVEGFDPEIFNFIVPSAGTYYIRVRGYGGTGGPGQFYHMTMDREYIPNGTIAGRVTDEVSNPLANAWIGATVRGQVRGVAFTDSTGRYDIELPAGTYDVEVYKEGYLSMFFNNQFRERDADPVDVVSGQTTPGIDFALPVGAMIRGTVRDYAGNPLGGMDVDIYVIGDNYWDLAVHTNPDGTYEVDGLRSDRLLIRVTSCWDGAYLAIHYNGQRDFSSGRR